MSASIKLEGLEDVMAAIDDLYDEEKIADVLGKSCALVERDAKTSAPKGDGALRNSITSKVDGLTGIVFTPLFYAPYVEYGTGLFSVKGGRTDVPWRYKDDKGNWHTTSGQKPQPYLIPALNNNREEIAKLFMEVIKSD